PSSEVDVEVTVDPEATDPITAQMPSVEEPETKKARLAGQRHKTVALSEEDHAEVLAATQEPLAQQQQAPAPQKKDTQPQPPVARPPDANRTMQLSAVDVKEISRPMRDSEPMSVHDIDIQELADRAESSGEIEVDVDAEAEPVDKPADKPADKP